MSKVTIVIATFNSEKTIRLVLNSILMQKKSGFDLEILVVDGGSSDNTKEIARQYGCLIINNEHTEPIKAKHLGFVHASGQYLLYLDHDEVLTSDTSIARKLGFLKKHGLLFVLPSGYKDPSKCSIFNTYINEFGDPFTYFIYRISKNSNYFLGDLEKFYKKVFCDTSASIFRINKNKLHPIIELVAGGCIIHRSRIINIIPEHCLDAERLPHLFYELMKIDERVGVVKNDSILHYSSEGLSSSINKLKWRIKNNIFFKRSHGASGFYGRNSYAAGLSSWKKFLFVPYAFLIFPALIDSIYLCISRRNIKFFTHLFLTQVVFWLILYYSIKKILGYREAMKSYDETTLIETCSRRQN